MKYLIIRCEDHARAREETASLLEGAKVAYLHHLAQAGAAGVIRAPTAQGRSRRGDIAIDRFSLHRALVGLGSQDSEAAPGLCAAVGANLQLVPEDTAWCCDLVTQQDGKIVDPTAGRITTKESAVLIHTLNERLGSETQRWEVGADAHHLLVLDDPILGDVDWRSATRAPELLVGRTWRRGLPRGGIGERLRELMEHASTLLEEHPINRVRIDLGENPANLAWLWGGAQAKPQRGFSELTGRTGAVVSNGLLLRGLAHVLGLDWKSGPTSLGETPVRHVTETLERLVERHDLIEVHLEIDLEDPIERQCAMERIDQLLLKPAADLLSRCGSWRLAVVIDDRRLRGSIPVIAIGNDLPSQPVASLTEEALASSPLVFEDGVALFAWLTQGEPARVS
jgi:2,3-bisphosphoglycerate-independent phosphoglycerate mutase